LERVVTIDRGEETAAPAGRPEAAEGDYGSDVQRERGNGSDRGPQGGVTELPPSPRQIRLALRNAGYSPIPLRGKIPEGEAWQKKTETNPAEIALWDKVYQYATSTGCLTRLLPAFDIDVLNPEAVAAAATLALERYGDRGRILVRVGKAPKCAIPFRTTTPFRKIKIKFVTEKDAPEQALEFLCDGQQFVVHGVHPDTQQPYTWLDGALWEVNYNDLPIITAEEALTLAKEIAALLVRDYGYTLPKRAEQDRVERSRKDVGAEPIDKVLRALSIVPNDDSVDEEKWFRVIAAVWDGSKGDNRARAAFYEWSEQSPKHNANRTEERWQAFFRDPPAEITVATLYGYASEADPEWKMRYVAAGRSIIKIIKGQIARIVDETESALIAAGVPIFSRSGMLVHPITDTLPAADDRKTTAVLLRPMKAESIVYQLNRDAAVYEKFDEKRKKWVAADPPKNVAAILLEKGEWQFPRIVGVTTVPTMRPDGTILDQPGYDEATQLWYAPDKYLAVPPISKDPTEEDAIQALNLLKSLLVEFPFVDELDRAVAVAGMMTPVLRGAMDVTPAFLIRAPQVSTGKSFLVDLVATIATGWPCPVITNCKNEEEMEKRLGALIIEGVPIFSLDNCTIDLGGEMLCQITERRLVRPRILGKSHLPLCESRASVFATGNNIGFAADMTRRGLTANLDTGKERPELRQFESNPVATVLSNRGKYVAAILTIARAWRSAKVEEPPQIASYGKWSRAVRAPLIWLGMEDPVKAIDQAWEEDPVKGAARDLIEAWRAELVSGIAYTAGELVAAAVDNVTGDDGQTRYVRPSLRAILMQQAGDQRGGINASSVSWWLKSIKNQVYAGCRIEVVAGSARVGIRYILAVKEGGETIPF
jgi:putative DNA primase/helicase